MANIGGRREKRPKALHHMRIMMSEKGGHIVEHHYDGYDHAPEQFPFGKNEGRAAATHVIKHMGMDVSKQLSDGENHEDGAKKLEEEGD